MTEQAADQLINECPQVHLAGLRVYDVVREHSRRGVSYRFTTQPSPNSENVNTALWKGYLSKYRLAVDGRLILEAFEYPVVKGSPRIDVIGERLSGDFWLEMRPSFLGPRVFIPFHDGVIEVDTAKWICEQGQEAATWQCPKCRHSNSRAIGTCSRCKYVTS